MGLQMSVCKILLTLPVPVPVPVTITVPVPVSSESLLEAVECWDWNMLTYLLFNNIVMSFYDQKIILLCLIFVNN